MEVTDGKIIATRAELANKDTKRQIEVMATKALRNNGIEQSFDDMRSAMTIAEDCGLLIVDGTMEASIKTESLVV